MLNRFTTINVVAIHPGRVEVRRVYNDLVGWRFALGDYQADLRTVALNADGDAFLVNGEGRCLLLPENPLASSVVDEFHPGFVTRDRVYGPVLLVSALDGNVLDANQGLADYVIRFARREGIPVSYRLDGVNYVAEGVDLSVKGVGYSRELFGNSARHRRDHLLDFGQPEAGQAFHRNHRGTPDVGAGHLIRVGDHFDAGAEDYFAVTGDDFIVRVFFAKGFNGANPVPRVRTVFNIDIRGHAMEKQITGMKDF